VIRVTADGIPIGNKEGIFYLRRAPGHELVCFDQVIPFNESDEAVDNNDHHNQSKINQTKLRSFTPSTRVLTAQDYELQEYPIAMLLHLVIHTAWGDPFYVGADRIEVMNSNGSVVPIDPHLVSCTPSLQSLSGAERDPRLAGNLVKRHGNTTTWLAPLAASLSNDVPLPPSGDNEVYIPFSKPCRIAAIRIWNYSKTPHRGIRDISIFLDGLLVMCTRIEKSTTLDHQTILFTNNKSIVQTESKYVRYCGSEEQDVLCVNEKMVSVKTKQAQQVDPSAVGVWDSKHFNVANRPTTSVRP